MLNDRQTKLLKIIVEDYVKTARPVSSKAICDNLNCSSATIRNVMFMGCESMKEILVGEGWTEPSEVDKVNMFRDCGVTGVTKVTGT